jgi:anti-anti-sigma factor
VEALQVHSSRRGNTVILTLSGPLTAKHVAALRRASFEVETQALGPCVLDLNDVDEIDGYGLSTLVGILARRGSQNGRVALCGVRPDLRERFEATFCDTLFPLRSTLAAALEAVGEDGP